jgi:hypothetical protein
MLVTRQKLSSSPETAAAPVAKLTLAAILRRKAHFDRDSIGDSGFIVTNEGNRKAAGEHEPSRWDLLPRPASPPRNMRAV